MKFPACCYTIFPAKPVSYTHLEKTDKTMQEMKKQLDIDFSFMPYAPMLFISAKTGQRVNNLYELIKKVDEQNARRISTGMLNDMLNLSLIHI